MIFILSLQGWGYRVGFVFLHKSARFFFGGVPAL
jgi:hypothetical protein